ncbi:MAG: hypothetical protein A3G23_07960 [Bacteroidetes bacterium RIFCSPLOWO2_12_FULL_37_12]|nr:MAG: hypothetical protein A3G23_07960 [Bacteroidetes bacterium RIFCSPLOWO2_12_FULL_37_12]
MSDTLIRNAFIIAYSPPTSNFSATPLTGCAPLPVTFTDRSSPNSSAIVTWYWDFGDGNYSNDRNPKHSYTTGGSFTVALITTDANGCNNYFSIGNYVKVYKPHAEISSPGIICADNNTVTLNQKSTGEEITFRWDFGDASPVSTLPFPEHTFPSQGSYSISLFISDKLNCRDSSLKNITITDFNADFTYTVNCFEDEYDTTFLMDFNDISSPLPVAWQWDFGDGKKAAIQNVDNLYIRDTSYEITLIARSSTGCSDTMRKIYSPPRAVFEPTPDSTCFNPGLIDFENFSTGSDSIYFKWFMGNGVITDSIHPSIYYSIPDSIYDQLFYVHLITYNKFGCSDTSKDSVYVIRNILSLVTDPPKGCTPLTVEFSDSVRSISPITERIYDFGDGSATVSEHNPVHTYNTTGYYPVKLIIENETGCRDTLEYRYIRAGALPLSVDFGILPNDTFCHHNILQFNDLSVASGADFPINDWCWIFHYAGGMGHPDSLNDSGYVPPIVICEDSGFVEVHTSVATVQNPPHDFDEYESNCYSSLVPEDSFSWVKNTAIYGLDSVLLYAGYNGCYDSIVKPVFEHPPTAVPGYYIPDDSRCYLSSCSPPVTFGFFNGSVEFDSTVYFRIKHKKSETEYDFEWNLDSLDDPLFHERDSTTTRDSVMKKTFINFTRAGEYEIFISVHNTITNCTDIRNRLITIDSVTTGFTIDPPSSCLSENRFTFTDTSKSYFGKIHAMTWLFGDGDSASTIESKYDHGLNWTAYMKTCPVIHGPTDSILPKHGWGANTSGLYKKPTHVYKDTGMFIVRLILSVEVPSRMNSASKFDYYYCKYELVDTVYLRGTKARYAVSDSTQCLDYEYQFTDISYSTGNIISYDWDFNDNTPHEIIPNPKKVFSKPGLYDVTLLVTDDLGCTGRLWKNNYIYVTDPIAKFTVKDTVCKEEIVLFSNSSLGDSLSFNWFFGDDSTSNKSSPLHSYLLQGNYEVDLFINDINGCRDSVTDKKMVVQEKPSANFKADTTSAFCPPLIVNFLNLSTGNPDSYLWDFGDSSTSDLANPVKTYGKSGNYDVKLIAYNVAGCTDTFLIPGFIKISGPYGNFSINPDTICAPDTVSFIVNTSNAYYYIWDYGDGNTYLAVNPSDTIFKHPYDRKGNFYPALVIKNLMGCSFDINSIIPVYSIGLNDTFKMENRYYCGSDTIMLMSPIDTSITNVIWDFGDNKTDTSRLTSHVYDTSGNYFIKLTLFAGGKCIFSQTDSLKLRKSPDIFISINADSVGCAPADIQTTVLTDTTGKGLKNWNWFLGDSTKTNTEYEPTVSFANPGKYLIQLNYSYDDGNCNEKIPFNVSVEQKPTVDYNFILPLPCDATSGVRFLNKSNDSTISIWDFGDGNVSTDRNPVHVFENDGEYNVKLRVSDLENICMDSVTQTIRFTSKPENIIIPNVFTPNPSSPGINDTYKISGLPPGSKFNVFDRWGVKIYQSDNYANDWDGRNLSGGVYYYFLEICNSEIKNGWIFILKE